MRLKKVFACLIAIVLCTGFLPNVYADGEISALSEIKVSNADVIEGATIQTDGSAGDVYANGYLKISNVNFGNRLYKEVVINYAVAEAYAGGKILIYPDSLSAAPLVETVLPSTGTWEDYKDLRIAIDNPYIAGIHDLYIKFGTRSMCNFKSVKFVSADSNTELPSDIVGTDIEYTVQKLAALGIYDLSSGSFKPASVMTNAEVFEIVKKFRPYAAEEYISKYNMDFEARAGMEDILNIFAYIAGYGEIEGMPADKSNLGIFSGVSIKNGKITRADFAKCLDNFLDVEVYKLTDKKYEKSGSTVLNECFNVYKAQGVVKSGEYTAMVGSPKKNSVVIGDFEYSIDDESIYQYFGQNVKFLYKDENRELSLCYAEPYRNNILELTNYDIDSYGRFTLRYTLKDMSSVKSAVLNNNFILVYNNKVISEFEESLFTSFNGSLKLIDNNRDSKYDVVIMTDTYDVIITSYSDGKIYGKGGFSLVLKNKNYILRTVTGEIVNDEYLSKLRAKTVLSIAEVKGVDGEDLTDISISNMTASGVLKSCGHDDYDRVTLLINGVEYVLSDRAEGYSKNMVGSTVNAYLNVNREIVYIESGVQADMVGYMEKYSVDEEEEKIYVKMFGEDEVIHNYVCADKVKIDGKAYKKTNNIKTALNVSFQQGLVKYSVNESDEIIMIDFPYRFIKFDKAEGLKENENPNSLYISFDGKSNYKWYGRSFWGNSTLSGDSRVFLIPTDGDIDKYVIKRSEDYFSNDTSYTVKAYGYNKEQISAPLYLVMYDGSSSISNSSTFAIVTDVQIDSLYDSEKEELTSIIEYIQGGVKGKKKVVSNIKSELAKINVGDAVKFNVDLNGDISTIQKIFDINTKKEQSGTTGFDTAKRYMTVKIKKINDSYAVIDGTLEITNLSCGSNVYMYDSSKNKKERIQIAELADIITLESSIYADTVFITQYHGETKGVYIIR